MSTQSANAHSKLAKETQEETVKRVQSQQYRYQSNIIHVSLLPPSLTPYLFHTPLQSPHFDCQKTNADIVGISQHLKSNKQTNKKKRILTVKQISHSQTKLTHPKFDAKFLHSLQSHPSGSRLLIFLKKSSILFKLFISIEIICRAFEAKNFIEFRLYLLLFTELLKIRLSL